MSLIDACSEVLPSTADGLAELSEHEPRLAKAWALGCLVVFVLVLPLILVELVVTSALLRFGGQQ